MFAAIALGVAIAYFIPAAPGFINSCSGGTTNISLAIGLLLMMYLPLTKVHYKKTGEAFKNTKVPGASFHKE